MFINSAEKLIIILSVVVPQICYTPVVIDIR